MRFKKAPPDLVEIFNAVMPGPPAQRRLMFGNLCGFLNGNMFVGLLEDQLFLRLPEAEREQLKRTSGAKPFAPMPNRPMKEYVVVPKSILGEPRKLVASVRKSREYAASLPAKIKSAKSNADKKGKTRK